MKTFPVVYDRALTPTLGPSLGAKALRTFVMERYPVTDLGIYNHRSVVGGSSLSKHARGEAWDAGLPYRAGGTPEGWALANWCVTNSVFLGIQQVIYARRIWTNVRAKQGWRFYSGKAAHYEHVHIELTRMSANELTYHLISKLNGEPIDMTIPPAAVEALLIARVKASFELFPNRDPDIAGLRYWCGLIINEFRAGRDCDRILNALELALLNELPLDQRQALAELVTDSKG